MSQLYLDISPSRAFADSVSFSLQKKPKQGHKKRVKKGVDRGQNPQKGQQQTMQMFLQVQAEMRLP